MIAVVWKPLICFLLWLFEYETIILIDIWLGEGVERRIFSLKDANKGFPGGSVVRNPPANAGDTGLIPDPARSHMLQSNKAMRHNYLACAPELMKPVHLRVHTQQGNPPQWEARPPYETGAPACHNWRKHPCSNKDPAQPKPNKYVAFLRMQRDRMKWFPASSMQNKIMQQEITLNVRHSFWVT